ncbi:hypothetical protein CSUI_003123, partial [Cystoisospora suis]
VLLVVVFFFFREKRLLFGEQVNSISTWLSPHGLIYRQL